MSEAKDRQAIVALLDRYAQALDTRRWELLDEVFDPEVVFDFGPDWQTRGRDAAVARIRASLNACGPTQHLQGNHRIEIFDQDGNYLDSRYSYGRISGIFITDDDMLYAIDSESSGTSHPNWVNGVRIGHLAEDHITGYIPPFAAETRPYQGAAGEGVAVDADGNVFAAEGPNSLRWAGGAFTKYAVGP